MKAFKYLCAVLIIAGCASKPAAVSVVEPPKSDGTFLERVYAKLRVNDVNGALALFNTLKPGEAAKSSNLLVKAAILISADRFIEARTAAETALANSSAPADGTEANFVLATISGFENKQADQKKFLDAALKINPAFVPALNAHGNLSLYNNNMKDAAHYFDIALQHAPSDLDALVGRAAVFRFQRKSTEAIERLTEAIIHYPQEAEPYAQRGRIQREQERYNEALADLSKAKELRPHDYWILYDRARTLLLMNKKKESLAEFEAAEKINPNVFASYIYSAGIRDDFGDYKNAQRDYEALVKLKPDYYFGLEMLGVHYMREKRYAAARDMFRSAYSKAPGAYNYALLAVINGLQAGDKQALYKPFIEEIIKKIDRKKPEYNLLRLFYDFSGDADIARRTGSEKDVKLKAQNLFYLGNYYNVRGQSNLAQKCFAEFKNLERKDISEWRIYQWTVGNG